jgi:hypothetical protein
MDMLGLEAEMTYRVRTTDPLAPTEGSPLGTRQYWQVSEATLEGDRIHAKLARAGTTSTCDWRSASTPATRAMRG